MTCTERVGILEEWTDASSRAITVARDNGQCLQVLCQVQASWSECLHLVVEDDSAFRACNLVGEMLELCGCCRSETLCVGLQIGMLHVCPQVIVLIWIPDALFQHIAQEQLRRCPCAMLWYGDLTGGEAIKLSRALVDDVDF